MDGFRGVRAATRETFLTLWIKVIDKARHVQLAWFPDWTILSDKAHSIINKLSPWSYTSQRVIQLIKFYVYIVESIAHP
jgi:hypothetical protein